MNTLHFFQEPMVAMTAVAVGFILSQLVLGWLDTRRFRKFMKDMEGMSERRAQMVIDLMSYTWEHPDGTFRPDQPIPRPKGQAITERETAHAMGLCRRTK